MQISFTQGGKHVYPYMKALQPCVLHPCSPGTVLAVQDFLVPYREFASRRFRLHVVVCFRCRISPSSFLPPISTLTERDCHPLLIMSLTMSKVTDEPASYTRVARLTSTGDGREAARRRQPVAQTLTWDDTAVSDDEEDDDGTAYGYGHAPAEQVPYSNIQEIIPGLFIGDVTAAMDHALLKSKNITVIIAASEYTTESSSGIALTLKSPIQCANATPVQK